MFVRKSVYDRLVAAYEDVLIDRIGLEEDAEEAEASFTTSLAERDRRALFLEARLAVADASLGEAQSRLSRIIALETPGMAHAGRKAIRLARGEVL